MKVYTKLFVLLLTFGVSLVACNGAGDGGSATSKATTTSLYVSQATPNDSCFALVESSGSAYTVALDNSQPSYTTAAVDITFQNVCSLAQAIRVLNLNLNDFTINSLPALVDYVSESQFNNPYLTPAFTSTDANVVVSLTAPSNAEVAANGKYVVTVHAHAYSVIDSLLIASIGLTTGDNPVVSTTGNLTIQTGTVAESTIFTNLGTLSGTVTNESTNTKTAFSVGLESSVTLQNLPSGIYAIKLQGVGDAAAGLYYATTPTTATVIADETTSASLNFTSITTAQNNVAFSVANAPSGQTVIFTDNNDNIKYNVDNLTAGSYKFLTSESIVAVTINALGDYSMVYTPHVITPTVTSVAVTFTALPPSGLTTFNDQIIDLDGNGVKLKGINWFGFNNSNMVNGLWNYDGISGDFQTTVLRFKALGFNAVRLPFVFANIMANASADTTIVHSGLTLATKSQLKANLTDSGYSTTGKRFPELTYSLTQTSSNDIIPQTSCRAAFIWMIDFFARNGFYVLVDNHFEDGSIKTDAAGWTQNWKSLASDIVNGMPATSSGRVMYDIRNEPDHDSYNWTQMGPIYLATMDAINSVTKSKNLFFIEGSGQGGINANWGDGFDTNESDISTYKLSDPNQFFESLATKSYINQVVLSPHVYPPSVTNATESFAGAGLYNRLNRSFGTLTKTGYCAKSGGCHRFPVAVGEFGSFFESSATDDMQFMQSFASYLNHANDAEDGLHDPIDNWFYWSYNPNSGDTGGIVDGSTWVNIQWQKIEFLSYGALYGMTTDINPNGIGLTPWYK